MWTSVFASSRQRRSPWQSLFGGGVVAFASTICVAAENWPTYRGDVFRSGSPATNAAEDIFSAERLTALHVVASWRMPPLPSPDAPDRSRGFWSSPVVDGDRLFIGGGDGYLYALDRRNLTQLWRFPKEGAPALTSQFVCNPSSFGIAASAAIGRVGDRDAVIFGAPDRTIGDGFGDGRLFALAVETGDLLWASSTLAPVTGLTSLYEADTPQEQENAFQEQHQQIGYSAPLIVNDRVYVGIADHCDNPIQSGSIKAVFLADGALDSSFQFTGALPRGGGIWSSVASDGADVFATTGNMRGGMRPGEQVILNHSLALLKVDGQTGILEWKLQPVPMQLDDDPDWASGPTILNSSCGRLAVSTMKDGWTYAVAADLDDQGDPDIRWQFPPTGYPFKPTDNWTAHGDTRFLKSGLGWGETFVSLAAGLNINVSKVSNYARLHAFNACAPERQRLRWIFDVPHTNPGEAYSLGVPSGQKGFFFVGTRSGWLVVFADPSVAAPAGYRCEHPDVSTAICGEFGFALVPDPKVIAEVQLQGSIFGEPILLDDMVYVATTSGQLYALGVD